MSRRDQVKQYFKTGLYPTQAQFWETFDDIVFKDDPATEKRIEGDPGQAVIPVPAKAWIDKIGFVGAVSIRVNVGTIAGGHDVWEDEPVDSTGSLDKDVYFENDGNLYFSGLDPATKVIIFYR